MNVHFPHKCRYVVVQFLEPPYQNIDDYVCIPNSWIQKRGGADSKSIIAYPNERLSVTERRIKDGENPSRLWKFYVAVVKYEAFSYEDAKKFIWLKTQAASNENSLSYIINDDLRCLPVTAAKKNRSSVKRINYSKPHSERNNKKLNVDKATFVDTISNSRVDSTTLISSKPPGFDFPDKMSEVTDGINSSYQAVGSRSQGAKKKTLKYTRSPLNIVNQVTNNHQASQKNESSFIHHNNLHKLELIQATIKRRISSIQAFYPDVQKKLRQDSDIQPQVLLKPDRKCTDLEHTIQTPSPHNQTLDALNNCFNSAEHQDSDGQMVGDKSSEASCLEQNVISEQRSKNEFSDKIVATEDVSSTQYIDDGVRSISLIINSEVMTTTSEKTLKQSDPSVESITNKADMLENELVKLVRKLKLNISQTYQAINDLCKSTAGSVKAFERLVNKVENLQKSKKSQVTVMTPKKVTAEVQTAVDVIQDPVEMKEKENPDVDMKEDEKRHTGEESKRREDDADDDGNEKDSADENEKRKAPKKVRGNIRTFVLPPEYDPADSRWTLKYRKNDPKLGLVELIPNSKVFISSIRLSHCKRVAKDCKMLARMLFVEIFTQSALSVCSLTGARAKAFDIDGTHIRPGLDEKARMAILTFVENYAREKGWESFKLQSIINSIRSKVQEIRAKHGQKA